MKNDDEQVGRILTRREVLVLLGSGSIAALAAVAGRATDFARASEDHVNYQPLVLGAEDIETTTATPTITPTTTATPAATPEPTATTTRIPACVVRPEVTEGPYFVDERLNRSDIRIEPSDGSIREGALLALTFNVSQISSEVCAALPGAQVDVWHCDAEGHYSDVSDPRFDTTGLKFLRGYQVTDSNGLAQFTTIYPGWYSGRAVHIHFKIRLTPDAAQGYEFTSQLFFDDSLSQQVFSQSPYRGNQDTLNSRDSIYKDELLLTVTQ
ncbi:MAG: intradiol ring-cleavage dioxygenase, partial [Chloroflexota bacterium]